MKLSSHSVSASLAVLVAMSLSLSASAFVPLSSKTSFVTTFRPSVSLYSAAADETTAATTSTTTATKSNDDWANPARYLTDHPNNNIPPHIAALVGRGLHLKRDHPIGIIRAKIEEYFQGLGEKSTGTKFTIFDAEDPIVTTKQCFDDLRLPANHPGRSPSDTYYVTDTTLLRTHTSAHQSQHLTGGHHEAFLCTGDVYRRDEIDASHYPAFHQLEGVKLFPVAMVQGADTLKTHDEWIASPECQMIATDLKQTLEGLMDHLFGPVEKRWADDSFPFTEPSFELEILFNGDNWLEVLGCGVIHTEVLENVNQGHRRGWAFGLGLERLAMVLFEIPDIRLFWTQDERFTGQFAAGQITKFVSYSKYPPCLKDIAFWLPDLYVENDFFELARGIAGDLIESMELIDEFTNKKTNRTSKCYRITYRSMDRSLTNEEIDALQEELRVKSADLLGLEVR
jgi:phenylalanyl-tRNA synthetase alpha chain